MAVVGDRLGGEDRDRLRPELGVDAVAQPVRRSIGLRDVDMGGHRQRVDAGVGPPGGVERRPARR